MEKEGVVCLVFIPSGGKFLTAACITGIRSTLGVLENAFIPNCPYCRDRWKRELPVLQRRVEKKTVHIAETGRKTENICADPGRIENDACRSYQKNVKL